MPGNTRRNPTVFPYRGKFRVQYQDLLGNQRTITAETKEDAYLKLEIKHLLGSVLGMEPECHRLFYKALDSLSWAIQRSGESV